MAQIATQSARERACWCAVTAAAMGHAARHPKITTALGHAYNLGEYSFRLRESLVDRPQRAGSPGTGKVKICCRLALGNVTRAIDTNEKERHTPRVAALQRGQPVANRFKAHAELFGEKLEVVALSLRRRQEASVRQ